MSALWIKYKPGQNVHEGNVEILRSVSSVQSKNLPPDFVSQLAQKDTRTPSNLTLTAQPCVYLIRWENRGLKFSLA